MRATDSGGLFVETTFTVTVNPVNDAPTTAPVTLAPIAEDSGARLITQAELLANATDVEGNALTATGLAIAAGSGALVDNGNGTWTYTPARNDDTAVAFSYAISDGTASVAGSATVDIAAVNDPPVNTVPGPQAGFEDTPLAITGLAVNDPDGGSIAVTLAVGNGALTVNLAGGATITGGANGSATLTLSGTVAQVDAALATLSYLGAQDWSGADTLSVTTTDPGALVDNDSVALAIAPVNDAPILANNSFTVSNGGTLVLGPGDLSAIDVDGPAAGLAFTVGGVTHGRFELIGAPGVPITTFTQAEILAGQVRFVHDGSGIAPAFTLEVSDGAAIGGPYPGNVVFNAGGGGGGGNAPGNAVGAGAVAATQLTNSQTPYDPGLALSARPDVLPHPLLPLVRGVAQVYVRTPTGPLVTTTTEETGGPPAAQPAPATQAAPTPVGPSSSDAPTAGPAVEATPASGSIDAKPDELPTAPATDAAELSPVLAEMDSIETRQGSIAPTTRPERTVLPGSLWIAGVIASLGAIAWVSRATGLVKKLRVHPSPRGRGGIPVVARDDEEQQDANAIVAPPRSKEASPDKLRGTSAEDRE